MSIDTPSDAESAASHTPRTGSTTFITTSGGLLTDELVNKLRQRQCAESAVRPETFALPNTEPPEEADLEEELGDVWNTLRERWDELTMDNELFGMDVSDARNKWMLKLFRRLGFEPVFQRENLEAGGIEANLSHKGWPDGDIESYGEMEGRTAPILHTVEPGQKLDEKPEDAPRGAKSPHDTLQEFLNASDEHDWAVVTNGLTLRVLRDFYHTYTRGYVEFDLENLFTNRNYGDFRALYRLCHATRFIEPVVADEEDDAETPLEQLYQVALSTGVKVGQDLQENVVNALETLGNGFLNSEIEAALEEGGQDAAEDYYQDLLYVVYRLLFLMFAEQRGMMSQRDSLYTEEYSVTKLRERAEQREKGDRNTDLWEGLKATFQLVGEGDKRLGVPGYNGDLFDNSNLEYILGAECPNEKLLSAVDDLTHIEQEGYRQRISYADLGVEEIGAVYESLLEFTPQIAETAIELEDRTISPDSFYLDDRGMERKETGSYYTDPGLIDELIQSALDPVVEERVSDDAPVEVQEQQLLDITFCDPACGSGAFLIAANNFLGQRLAEIRSDSLYPNERTIRQSRRSVVQHCIYGVDLNPMAVELAKVSLWINSAVENKPLSFLDHRIKQGNSLLGTTPELMDQGVPVDAFETSQGRDWHEGNDVRKRVRTENKNLADDNRQIRLDSDWDTDEEDYVNLVQKIEQLDEKEIGDIHEKEALYQELRESESFQREKLAYDIWTASFFWPLDGSADEYPTPNIIEEIRREPPEPTDKPLDELTGLQEVRERATRLSEELSVFHWPIEFPQVFKKNGFDCILGNPPWERVKIQAKEFFATRKPQIANADNKSKRKELISNLEESDPDLYEEYQEAVSNSKSINNFFSESGQYDLAAKGDINYYPLFAELSRTLINGKGRVGLVIASGIATDYYTQDFFQDLVENKQIVSLYDFENRNAIFPGIHRSYKFSLLTLTGEKWPAQEADFAFYLTKLEHLRENDRHFTLSDDDIELLNPDTRSCPTFRSKTDAEITKKIYRKGEHLNAENSPGTWDIDFLKKLIDLSMHTDIVVEKEGDNLINMKYDEQVREEDCLRLYEAKLIHQFDHRYAEFPENDPEDAVTLSEGEKKNPDKTIDPRYWVLESDVESRLEDRTVRYDGIISLRGNSRSTDSRTLISCLRPYSPASDTLSNLFLDHPPEKALCFLSHMNSFVADYCARQKVGGINVGSYIIDQLPINSIDEFDYQRMEFIVPRTLELTYTANDLTPFAKSLWESVDKSLQESIISQWSSNNESEYQEKEFLQEPFEWDEERRLRIRAQLDAYHAHLFDINKNELEHILSTFPVLKENQKKQFGSYKSNDMTLKYFEQYSGTV
jgi:hypothetical protein